MCIAHHLHSCHMLLFILAIITLDKSNLCVIAMICACYLACRSNCTCSETTCCSMHQTLLYWAMRIHKMCHIIIIHASCVIVQVLTWTSFRPLFLTLLYTHTLQALNWQLQLLAVSSAQVYHGIAHALNSGHELFLVHHESKPYTICLYH